jgi:ABC-type Fe3+-siderophore transport system permease subunit
MLTEEEEAFIQYWEKNSTQQKHSTRPFMIGLSAGFVLGVSLIAVVFSGWYERANMVANSRLSSFVFLLAILGISFFMAFIYRKFRWESKEQQYRELLAKKKTHEKNK